MATKVAETYPQRLSLKMMPKQMDITQCPRLLI